MHFRAEVPSKKSKILVRYSAIRRPNCSIMYVYGLLSFDLSAAIHSQLGNFRFPVREQNIPRQGKNKDRRVHNRVGSVVHLFFLLFLSCSSTVFLLPLSSPAPLPLRSIEAEGERRANGERTESERSKSGLVFSDKNSPRPKAQGELAKFL